jgi:cell division protein FtsI/penicillin-binding protein 2
MFHRRLLLLAAACGLAGAVLAGQTARLTLVQGAALRAEAQSRLIRHAWIPTTRGRILDRHGRVLAVDRPSYALAVSLPVLSGAWVRTQAATQARLDNKDRWDLLGQTERAALVEAAAPQFASLVEAMMEEIASRCGIEREELDARAAEIVSRVERMHSQLVERRIASAVAEAREAGRTLDERLMDDITRRARAEISEQRSAHVLVSDLDDALGFEFLRLGEQEIGVLSRSEEGERSLPRMPGLEVRDVTDRMYPFDRVTVDIALSTLPQAIRGDGAMSLDATGVAWHVLGRMRTNPTREEIEARTLALKDDAALRQRALNASGTDRGQYFASDAVGIAGLESTREHTLRGLRGLRTVHLDSGAVEELPPTPGEDVHVTLDVMLQARIQALMDPALGLAQVQAWHANEQLPIGTPLYGAAVVLDVDRAEVLAMVSTPHVPRQGQWFDDDDANARFVATNAPYVNRAIAKPYPPGSIAKAMMLVGASKAGRLNLDHGIECTGHLLANQPTLFRCWIYKHYNLTHSPDGRALLGPEALQRSCNIYFYTLGQRMGPRQTADVYAWFGVGDAPRLGAGAEWPGSVGPMNERGEIDPTNLGIQDAILMGIGQGPVTWTPLHAADAYATLARAGYRVPPHLIAGEGGRPDSTDLALDRRAVAEALEGLSLSVNHQNGTGHHLTYTAGGVSRREPIFNIPGVEVWGKTGTATAPDVVVDADGEGPLKGEVVLTGDHSWFVVLAGPTGGGPRFAIAVVMDYAGSGGRVSGPITNQILWALRAEGYL